MLLIALSTFACTVLVCLSIYWLVTRPEGATAQRLNQVIRPRLRTASATPVAEESTVVLLAERVTTPFQKLMPASPADSRKLTKKLMQAGYRSHNAPVVYRAVQISSLFFFPCAVMVWGLVSAKPSSSVLVWMMLALAVGGLAPRFILSRIIKKRQLLIQWGLPDALDLMVICIEAGLGLNAAMVRVAHELKAVHPDLCDEFEVANLEMRMGRERDQALRNLSERTGVDDLRSLIAMLIQADRFGTSIAKAVRIYSDALRTKRRQRAEQAAQKAAVKLLFPLALFIFPTLFIFVIGPAGIHLIDTFEKINN